MLTLRHHLKVFLSNHKKKLWDNCGGTHQEYKTSHGPKAPKSKLAYAVWDRKEFNNLVKNTRVHGQKSWFFFNDIQADQSQHFDVNVHGCAIAIVYKCRLIIHISTWNMLRDIYDLTYTIFDSLDAPADEFCTITSHELKAGDPVFVPDNTKKKRTFHLFLMRQTDLENCHYMFMYQPGIITGMPNIPKEAHDNPNTDVEANNHVSETPNKGMNTLDSSSDDEFKVKSSSEEEFNSSDEEKTTSKNQKKKNTLSSPSRSSPRSVGALTTTPPQKSATQIKSQKRGGKK